MHGISHTQNKYNQSLEHLAIWIQHLTGSLFENLKEGCVVCVVAKGGEPEPDHLFRPT